MTKIVRIDRHKRNSSWVAEQAAQCAADHTLAMFGFHPDKGAFVMLPDDLKLSDILFIEAILRHISSEMINQMEA